MSAIALLMLACVLADAPAAAQGRGNGRGRGARPVPASASASPATAGSLPASRTFGAWLDHADVLPPGESWLSVYTVFWRAPFLREIDAPVVEAAVGIAPRVHLGASTPYYNLRESGGIATGGFGDTYVHAKVALLKPGDRRVGLAASPALEIVSHPVPELGLRRFNWVLPLSAHLDRGRARVYGTGGYFTRGSLFGSGALEIAIHPRLTLTGTLTHAHFTRDDADSDVAGLSRHRTDVSGGFYLVPVPAVVLFANVGRTIGDRDHSGASFVLSAGMSVKLTGATSSQPRTRSATVPPGVVSAASSRDR